LQGEQDLPRFIDTSVKAGAPAQIYEGVEYAGPLASFEASDTWVDHPFTHGVALIGDAAASSDPTWGQGLSLTMRDVRLLRDCLLGNSDWEAAGNAYAEAHDRHFRVIRESTLALKKMFMESGDEADALRARALPKIAEDPKRVPDHIINGPDMPWNSEILDVFFGRLDG
jgi:2-polyprenyl-6-methoxyphenol hydroxylase-like FAD-dependent oxidoreductase